MSRFFQDWMFGSCRKRRKKRFLTPLDSSSSQYSCLWQYWSMDGWHRGREDGSPEPLKGQILRKRPCLILLHLSELIFQVKVIRHL